MTDLRDEGGTPIVNFGGNVSFTPRHRYAPRSEAEVLEVLDRHAGGAIRVIASLHSWSDDAVCDDVILDLRHFDRVTVETRDGETWATVGAGCVLTDALAQIRAAADATLPTIGLVTVQRMAGVVSTATHGSGRSSISHYVTALRVAAYDPETGKARICELAGGDELVHGACPHCGSTSRSPTPTSTRATHGSPSFARSAGATTRAARSATATSRAPSASIDPTTPRPRPRLPPSSDQPSSLGGNTIEPSTAVALHAYRWPSPGHRRAG